LGQERKCKLPYQQFYELFDVFSWSNNKLIANTRASWCMTPCTFSDRCRRIEEPAVSIFVPALYCENGKRAFIWKAVSSLPSYTASYLKHRPSDHDRHVNVKYIIIFCPFATYKCVDRPDPAKVLERRTASFLSVDLESRVTTFLKKHKEYACAVVTHNTPNFNDYLHCYNILLVLKKITMVTTMFVFVACPSERGAVMLEGKKCNMASAFAAYCLKSMVQIVSMSRSICKTRHSSLRNLIRNWATASSFNALE
jgi:hypothetical protein